MELIKFKNNYELLAKKYDLPDFKRINEEFEIERACEESETLLRVVRKACFEKVVSIIRFFDRIMNPGDSPLAFHQYTKSIGLEEKKDIEIIYDKLSTLVSVELLLDIDYSEKNEAKMIKQLAGTLEEIKPRLRKVLQKIGEQKEQEVKKEKSYFG